MSAASASRRTPEQQQEFALLVLIACVLAVAAVAAIVPWALAIAAVWLHSGRIAPLSLADALHAAISGELWSSDPAAAYPADTARLLPGAWGYWSTAALLAVTLAATIVAVAREIDARMGRTIADRRWWHLFLGRKPAGLRALPDRQGARRHRAQRRPRHRRHDRQARGAHRGRGPGADLRDRRATLGQDVRARRARRARARRPRRDDVDEDRCRRRHAQAPRPHRRGARLGPLRPGHLQLGSAARLRGLGARALGRALAGRRDAARHELLEPVLRRGRPRARRAAACTPPRSAPSTRCSTSTAGCATPSSTSQSAC